MGDTDTRSEGLDVKILCTSKEHDFNYMETVYTSNYNDTLRLTKFTRTDRYYCRKCLIHEEKVFTAHAVNTPDWYVNKKS